ncbi:MAG: aldo/keto reductase [Flavobacteriaceae bacterium]|nr:aldo/keto reductase [Flavobacteriaceae bacterium]
MKYTTLPNTDIKVSKLCLGSMTWGNQNTEAEGHEQMDYAFDQGINFIDTAELYPVPATAKTQGRTSEIIGSWLKKSGKRDDVVIASKITGTGDYSAHIRTTGFSRSSIIEAVELELERLQTSYIDLYQLHWPERQTNTFGQRDYVHNPNDPWVDNFNEILHTLQDIIDEGKIRFVGLSNESAWGTMRYLEESKTSGLPRMITIQNAYSMLNRTFEGDLAEVAMREQIGLLAYSPMAFGVLSGKYIKGLDTEKSRLNIFPNYKRYSSVECTKATKAYLSLAKEYELSLAQLALAFVTEQPFLTSNIIGATTMDQLRENIGSIDLELSEELLGEINAIHSRIPNPGP